MTTGGRAREHLGLVFFLLDGDFFAGFFDDRVEPESPRNLSGDVARYVLVDRRHRADLDELGDHVLHRNDHRGRKLLNGKQIGNFDRFEHARRRGGDVVALLLALALLLEQQFFLAVFFGRRLLLVNARRSPGRPPLEGAAASVADATPGRAGPGRAPGVIGRNGPLPAGRRPGGTDARLRRRAASARLRLCRPVRAEPHRDAALRRAGRAGRSRTGRGRGAGGGRRRLPADDRRLAGGHRTQLRDRLVGGLRWCGRPARGGASRTASGAGSASATGAGAGAAGLGAVRGVLR